MCGIVGTNLNISNNTFEQALTDLSNRGPDNIEYKRINSFIFGHTRLSIIDLDKEANQPLSIDGYTIIYNGEIYNYKELIKKYNIKCNTKSDTEALLRLYILKKEKILEELDGMFAFSIYNQYDDYLFLARDSMGEKPLYYYNKDKKLIYSSTVTSIQKCVDKLTLSKQAIWDFLTFSWIPEPNTIFNEIKSLPKSSYAIYKENNISISNYSFKYKKSSNDIVEETKIIVTQSINDRLLSDVKVGCFLSGGLDSSIVSLIAAKKVKNIDLFTIGFNDDFCSYTGFADETEYAKIVADEIEGSTHHILKISENDYDNILDEYIKNIDQPFAVSSGLGILAISKYAKEKNIKVLLSGDGADENFGGYNHYPMLKYNDLSYFSKDKPKGWHWRFVDSEKAQLLNNDIFGNIKPSIRLLVQDYLHKDPKYFIDHDKNFYLYNEMMIKLDRMTMASSIEGRAVFVAPKILKFTDTLSYNDLMKGGEKWILKEAFYEEIPKVIKTRKKHGFNTPMKVWFLDRWKSKLEMLFDKKSYLSKLNILNLDFNRYYHQYKDDKRFGELSFNLLILELWLNKYCSTKEYKIV